MGFFLHSSQFNLLMTIHNITYSLTTQTSQICPQAETLHSATDGLAGKATKWRSHESSHAGWPPWTNPSSNHSWAGTTAARTWDDCQGTWGKEENQQRTSGPHWGEPTEGEGERGKPPQCHETETRAKRGNWVSAAERNRGGPAEDRGGFFFVLFFKWLVFVFSWFWETFSAPLLKSVFCITCILNFSVFSLGKFWHWNSIPLCNHRYMFHKW